MAVSSVGGIDETWRLSDGELLAAIDAVEAQARRCYARKLALIRELDVRGLPESEKRLAEHAVDVDASTLRRIGAGLLETLNPDAPPPVEDARSCSAPTPNR